MANDILLHIIYLKSRMLLSKKKYADWRQIQDEFTDYMTSLGPWPADDVLDFLRTEYPTDHPFSQERIEKFLLSDDETIHA